MNDKQDTIYTMALLMLQNQIKEGIEVDEKSISSSIDNVLPLVQYELPKNERVELFNALKVHFETIMSSGYSIQGDEDLGEWYSDIKKECHDNNCSFWDRYKKFLMRDKFPQKVINSIDKDTDTITNLLGNPNVDYKYSRKGLVIGDVQSGKTANYIAVMNKAADAGYKIIILLTGTIEKLRKQTQERVNRGFIGKNVENNMFHVGEFNNQINVVSFTSIKSDFREKSRDVSASLSSLNDPVVFVVKKNKSVLRSLFLWLESENIKFKSKNGQKKIDYSLLLIDDEADNASINTNMEDNDPTAINEAIRKILGVFTKSSYLGYTATPYANIFIDPSSSEDMVHDDLFPKDYIYVLDTPDNYIGAKKIYSDAAEYSYMLQKNDDFEDYLPIKHKGDSSLSDDLPNSLKHAILSFFIANAIRDIRGEKEKHRSMLINVSRFINIHNQLQEKVEAYVDEVKNQIEYYSGLPSWSKYRHLIELECVYKSYFKDKLNLNLNENWENILMSLYEATRMIVVEAVNGGTASMKLNYSAYKSGLRIIAIGGLSLSRGLTLEGLMTSYFYRNSKMYDTLMQMGRWFGYRTGYADICQVWMNDDALTWYRDISLATEELKNDLRKGFFDSLTPMDFGIRVRSDEPALLVTARNKMRSADDHELDMVLDGNYIETPAFSINRTKLQLNFEAVQTLIARLLNNKFTIQKNTRTDKSNNLSFTNVPKDIILNFLDEINVDLLNRHFDTRQIINVLGGVDDARLNFWDIIFVSGKSKNSIKILEHEINYVVRSYNEVGKGHIRINKSRLGSPGAVNDSMSKDKYEELIHTLETKGDDRIKDGKAIRTIPDKAFFSVDFKRNPVLLIYLVDYSSGREALENVGTYDVIERPLVGLGLGIPQTGHGKHTRFKYKVNKIWAEAMYDCESEDDFDEIDE